MSARVATLLLLGSMGCWTEFGVGASHRPAVLAEYKLAESVYMGTRYFLARKDDGSLVYYEETLDDGPAFVDVSPRTVDNSWRDAKGEHFFFVEDDGGGIEVFFPSGQERLAYRLLWGKGRFTADKREGASRPRPADGYQPAAELFLERVPPR
jgi:hypothetical protein